MATDRFTDYKDFLAKHTAYREAYAELERGGTGAAGGFPHPDSAELTTGPALDEALLAIRRALSGGGGERLRTDPGPNLET